MHAASLALPVHPGIQTSASLLTDTEAEVATGRGDQAVLGGEVPQEEGRVRVRSGVGVCLGNPSLASWRLFQASITPHHPPKQESRQGPAAAWKPESLLFPTCLSPKQPGADSRRLERAQLGGAEEAGGSCGHPRGLRSGHPARAGIWVCRPLSGQLRKPMEL